MNERLKWENHQKVRKLVREAMNTRIGDPASDRILDQVRAMIERAEPKLGRRFLCPSGQTVSDFSAAVDTWR